jgi:hypothetical protein
MKFTRSRKWLAVGTLTTALAAGGAVSIATASSGSSSATGNAATGTGTIALKVTGPKGHTHTGRTRSVRCTVKNGQYVLGIGGRRRAGRSRVTLIVPSYHGAGGYTGQLKLRARVLVAQLQRTLSVPVTLTSDGGSMTVTRTLTGRVHPQLNGKTVSASASWTCTP